MKQYLLFDLDGTLTDPMVGITSSVQYALEKFGIHVRYLKELIPFIGPPLAESFQKFYGFSKEDAEKAIQYYREYYAPKGIFENEVYENKITNPNSAQHDQNYGELVCSNSLKSTSLENACGLLKQEIEELDSLIIKAAKYSQIPSGQD